MTRCYICDKDIEKPIINVKHGGVEPCFGCLEVIKETIYEDNQKDKPETDFENDQFLYWDDPAPIVS